MKAAEKLARLLEDERLAARHADVERLVQLQDEKQQALLTMQQESVDPRIVEQLANACRANLWLMRHLADCLRGVLGAEVVPTYGDRGQRLEASLGSLRGRL